MSRSRTYAPLIAGMLAFAAAIGPVAAQASEAPKAAAAPPARVQMTEVGPVFTTPQGRTLYTWVRDDGTPGKAQCTNERFSAFKVDPAGILPLPAAAHRRTCADKWPPFRASPEARPSGAWSLVPRGDGAAQWAYLGHPLYTSIKDKRAGDVNGALETFYDNEWRPARAPLGLPAGLKLTQRSEGLVLATADDRLLFWPRSGCKGCEPALKPVHAPAIAQKHGDWSVTRTSAGEAQYAFKGRPLHVAPEGVSDADILASESWAPALYRKAAPVPRRIKTALTLLGDVYTDQDGRLLYSFDCSWGPENLACNDPGDAASYMAGLCGSGADCARKWRPLVAARDDRPVGDWTIEDISVPLFTDPRGLTYPPETPRVKAWAYRGRPVYTYAEEEPGQMLGHGIKQTNASGFYVVQTPGNRETGR